MLPCSPAAVIGPGRVGRAISSMGNPAPAPLYGRNTVLPTHLKGPIWVCTTNDGLEDVLCCVQPSQRQQLIFIQNGMLLPWLTSHGLQHNTQVLLYMSAATDGSVTDGGRTAVCGPLAEHVVQLLQQGGVRCAALDSWTAYNSAMVVKLLWSSIFWLLSAGLGGAPVGDIVQRHAPAVEDLVAELLPIAKLYIATCSSERPAAPAQENTQQEYKHVELLQAEDPSPELSHITAAQAAPAEAAPSSSSCDGLLDCAAVMEQVVGYSLAIAAAVPSADMARKEFKWRNGWFLSMQPATPQHMQWLVQAGCQDLLEQYAAGQLPG